MVGVESGRCHQELGRERDEFVGHRVERMPHQPCADHLEEPRAVLVGLGREHQHVGSELGQRVRDREAGDSQAENPHAEAAPVGVPARERLEASREYPWIRTRQLCSHSK